MASPVVDTVQASAYTVPTDDPEADGTLSWQDTTLVLVQVTAGGMVGTGWTYASAVAAELVRRTLGPVIVGRPVDDITARWIELSRSRRLSPGRCDPLRRDHGAPAVNAPPQHVPAAGRPAHRRKT